MLPLKQFNQFILFPILATCALFGCAKKIDQVTSSGYIQVEQGKLFYQTFGKGTPIIVLHGGPGLDQSYLQPQMLELAKDHQMIFYDQRGSGKSLETKFNTKLISTNQFVQDLDALRIQLGFKKIVLLGHSWGGYVAMNYAIVHPDKVSALILMSSAPADFKGQQAFVTEFSKRTMPIKNKIHLLIAVRLFLLQFILAHGFC